MSSTAYINCPAVNESTQILIKGHKVINLEEGCSAVLPHYIFKAESHREIEATFVYREMVNFEGFRPIGRKIPSTIPPFVKPTFRTPLDPASATTGAVHSLAIALISSLITMSVLTIGGLSFRYRRQLHDLFTSRWRGGDVASSRGRASRGAPSPVESEHSRHRDLVDHREVDQSLPEMGAGLPSRLREEDNTGRRHRWPSWPWGQRGSSALPVTPDIQLEEFTALNKAGHVGVRHGGED